MTNTAAFTYLVPYDAVAGNIRDAHSRYVYLGTVQCAGLLSVTYVRVLGPLLTLSGLRCAYDEAEPEPAAGIKEKG